MVLFSANQTAPSIGTNKTLFVFVYSCYCLLYKWSRDPFMDNDDAGRKRRKKGWEQDCDIALGKRKWSEACMCETKNGPTAFLKGPFIFFSPLPFNCLYIEKVCGYSTCPCGKAITLSVAMDKTLFFCWIWTKRIGS